MLANQESALLAAGYLRSKCQEDLRITCPQCGTERVGPEPLELANGWQCSTCSGWYPAPRAVCLRCNQVVEKGLEGRERECGSPSAYLSDRAFCAFAPEGRIWFWQEPTSLVLHASTEGTLKARFSVGELFADTLVCELGIEALVAARMIPVFAEVAGQKPVVLTGNVAPPILLPSERPDSPASIPSVDVEREKGAGGRKREVSGGPGVVSGRRKNNSDIAIPAVPGAAEGAQSMKPNQLAEWLAIAAITMGILSLMAFPFLGIFGGVAAIVAAVLTRFTVPDNTDGKKARKRAKVGLWCGVTAAGLQILVMLALPFLSALVLAPSPRAQEVEASIVKGAWTEARRLATDTTNDLERNSLLDKIASAEAYQLLNKGDLERAALVAAGIGSEYQREQTQDKITLSLFDKSWKVGDLDGATRIAAGIKSEYQREQAEDKIMQSKLDQLWAEADLKGAARVASAIHSEYRREMAQDKITSRLATEALEKGDLALAAKEAAKIHSEYKRNSMLKQIKGAK